MMPRYMKINHDVVMGEKIGRGIYLDRMDTPLRGDILDESCIMERESVIHRAQRREFQT